MFRDAIPYRATRHERTAIDRLNRVLLIGGSGQLGTAIRRSWTDCEIVAPPHDALGLEDTAALRSAVRAARPGAVVNCAAFADVDACEDAIDRAMEINAFAVGRAAEVAAASDAMFLTLSTDYVFDGRKGAAYTEEDAPHPLSVYGRSKLEGERMVRESGARAFVVRTCGVYGESHSSRGRRGFVERVLRPGQEGPVRVVRDVIVSPTFAGDLAAGLRALLRSNAYGLYHAVNQGAVSWYDFAVEAARQAGSQATLEPISAAEWKAPALRPAFSALDSPKLRALGIGLPSWRDGIAGYLRSRPNS